MNKVLFTTPVLQHPAAGGNKLRIENSIKALSRISELHIISRVPVNLIGGIEAQKFYEKYCVNFLYSLSAVSFFFYRCLGKLQKLKIKFLNPDVNFIIKYCDKHSIDIIWFGYGNISFDLIYKIKKKRPDIKVVCDTDSVWSQFVLRELPFETDPTRKETIEKKGRIKQREEKEWVNFCDVTTAVVDTDADYYRKLAKDSDRIKIFSNVIDLDNYKHIPAAPEYFKKPCIYIAGSFGHKSPMDKGTRWFIKEVFPIIKEEIPEIYLYIVGMGSDYVLSDIKDNNIIIVGKVKSVLPYLCHADVSVTPLKFEAAGTKFKILEAGICGIPIVTTGLGAEGSPVNHEENILIADEPNDFADAIIRLVKNPSFGAEIANNLIKVISAKYGIEQLVREGEAILEYLGNKYK